MPRHTITGHHQPKPTPARKGATVGISSSGSGSEPNIKGKAPSAINPDLKHHHHPPPPPPPPAKAKMSENNCEDAPPPPPPPPPPNSDEMSKVAKRIKQTPQEIVDEFWSKFTTKKPGKVTTVVPANTYTDIVAKKNKKTVAKSTQTSYDEAAAMCRAKVEKIVKECRRINKKYRDPHFDIETDLKLDIRDCLQSLAHTKEGDAPGTDLWPQSVKRVGEVFDEPQFFIDGPTANDVRQGRDGDCWLMSALCTLSNKKGLIEKLCVARDEAVGVYGFVFYRDGEWVSEIVDDFLYLIKPDYDEGFFDRILFDDVERTDSDEAYRKVYQSNSSALYFAQCAHPQETWLSLLEKAYAKSHGDYSCIEGGFGGEAMEDLTGGVTSELWTTDILDKEYFWKEELMKVNQQFLFDCSTGIWGTGFGERKGIVELHAYSIQKAVEIDGQRLLRLKNPWGKYEWKGAWSDGSSNWTPEWMEKLGHRFGDDGDFWISYKDLLRKYQAFERTRLFGPEWRVTQNWTTLDVPWTLDYHDTHFAFSITKPGPVVIVLSQLDDRYFRGLQGQYRFDLRFRVHKAGHEDYLIRSQTPLRMTRSVNVELDLEAGDYEVRVKVDATRHEHLLPIEEVVRKNAKDRREKLIRIGLAYDLAHSRGTIIETPEEKAARKAHEKEIKEKARGKLRKKILKEREETHYLATKQYDSKLRKLQRKRAKRKAKLAEKKARKQARKAEKAAAKAAEEAEEAKKIKEAAELKEETESASSEHDGKSTTVAQDAPLTPESGRDDDEPTDKDSAELSEDKPEELEKAERVEKSEEPEVKSEQPKNETEEVKEKSEKDEVKTEESKSEEIPEVVEPAPVSETKETSEEKKEESEQKEDESEGSESESESESDGDDISSVGSLSDLSDREIEIAVDALQRSGPVPPVPDAPEEEEPDEFEKDPWNAVVVVGLRVYHKVGEEDQDDNTVTLKVIRPIHFDEEDDSDSDSDSEDDDEAKKEEEAECKTTGLDVDDSSKDATLQGEVADRKKSIMGDGRKPHFA